MLAGAFCEADWLVQWSRCSTRIAGDLEMFPSLDVFDLLCVFCMLCVFCLTAVRAGYDVISDRQLCQDYLRRKVITGRFHGLSTELSGHASWCILRSRLASAME